MEILMNEHPHGNQSVLTAGAALPQAKAAMILIHGRGADAQDILGLARNFGRDDFAYFAPNASRNTWYPYSFLNPIESNEPGITSGLRVISELLANLALQGFPAERVMLGGFSQGACLSLEYAARHARRFGGVVAFSGGLIGPEGTARNYEGDFAGTPVFLGCSDVDFHIPKERVHESKKVFSGMGASVTERIYPNMGHSINQDEIEFVREMMDGLVKNF
jgi:predicted esterase